MTEIERFISAAEFLDQDDLTSAEACLNTIEYENDAMKEAGRALIYRMASNYNPPVQHVVFNAVFNFLSKNFDEEEVMNIHRFKNKSASHACACITYMGKVGPEVYKVWQNELIDDLELVIGIKLLGELERVSYVMQCLRRFGHSCAEIVWKCIDVIFYFCEGQIPKLPAVFLQELHYYDPGHPLLFIGLHPFALSPGNLPKVYDHQYVFMEQVKSMERFMNVTYATQQNRHQISKFVHDSVDRFTQMMYFPKFKVNRENIMACATMFDKVFVIAVDLDVEQLKRMSVAFTAFITSLDGEFGVLYLKYSLHLLLNRVDGPISIEAQVVAVIVDEFKTNMSQKVYQNDLGWLWSQIGALKYDTVNIAIVYYMSVFVLARTQARQRVKVRMLKKVAETIIKPLYNQVVDFKQMKAMSEQQDLLYDESSKFDACMFNLLDFHYTDAMALIDKL